MAHYEPLPRGFVSLEQPTGCILQRPGHNPNPIQAKLHFREPDPTIGILEVSGERVLLVCDDGTRELRQHQPEKFLDFATRHAGRRCRFASGMLSFTDGPTPSISTTTPENFRHCRPAWADITHKAWRIGEPGSGGPVDHQVWDFDVTWCGKGPTGVSGALAKAPLGIDGLERRDPWATGLTGKIADLDARGAHTIELTGESDRTDWSIEILAGAVTAVRTNRQDPADRAEIGPIPLNEVATLADVVHHSYAGRENPLPEAIRVSICRQDAHR